MNEPGTTGSNTYEDVSDLLKKPDLLRERIWADGFAYFRQLIPTSPILELRRCTHSELHDGAPRNAESIARSLAGFVGFSLPARD